MAEKPAASRRPRLDQPVAAGRTYLPRYDDDAFGRTSERIARFLGTSRFLVYLTVHRHRLAAVEHARPAARCSSTRGRSTTRC